MLDIDLRNYNEMVRYEPAMDRLRALALWGEDVFLLIKHYSKIFAEDIDENGSISEDTVSRFSSAIATVEKILKITPEDIQEAKELQLYQNSGFWEMRRFLGQFKDIAEELAKALPDHIIAAGISGCIVAEYLGLRLKKDYGKEVPVHHMLFERSGPLPVAGLLPKEFQLTGQKILLVEDAVQESRTLGVMIESLQKLNPDLVFSLFSLVVVYDKTTEAALGKMVQVYTFDE